MQIEPSHLDFEMIRLLYEKAARRFQLEAFDVEEEQCIQTNLGCMMLAPTGNSSAEFVAVAFVPANTHLDPILDLRAHRRARQ